MKIKLCNHIAKYRKQFGISRSELAELVGITRQSLGLIESNKVIPSTFVSLRLAHVLNCTVEDLFFEENEEETAFIWADDQIQFGDRVVLATIDDRLVARRATGMSTYRTPALTAVAQNHLHSEQIHYIKSTSQSTAQGFIIAGCDLGLGLLTEHLQSPSTVSKHTALWIGVDNTQAIRQLNHGMIHVAAVHFPPDASTPHHPEMIRFQFAEWEIGWIIKRGNPKHFQGVDDLREGKFHIVNRPLGSGVRNLLDQLITSANISSSRIPQYHWTVTGHRQVAETIATGGADVGIGTASAAAMLHLDFIPIRKERCELWFPNHRFNTPAVQKLLETLNSDVFRWDLERFGPCDVTKTGQEVHK